MLYCYIAGNLSSNLRKDALLDSRHVSKILLKSSKGYLNRYVMECKKQIRLAYGFEGMTN